MRRKTYSVPLGKERFIGSDHPIVIQTMWDAPIDCVDDFLIERINRLKLMGCGVVRFGVPNQDAVRVLEEVVQKIDIPVVADIHFDYRIALSCMDFPIAKVRINPGNLGASWMVEEIISKAKDKGISIRIGVNGGSVAKYYRSDPQRARALANSALDQLELFEKSGFHNVVISVKDSNPWHVVEANRILAQETNYPLHLGVTEAGPLIPAAVKSSFFLGKLLEEGIGDTIRISISGKIEHEIMVARQLLFCLGLNCEPMPMIVSCPRCARATFDTHRFSTHLERLSYEMKKKIKVAVMGCVVNGPGEAGDADIAITGTGNKVLVYEAGKPTFTGTASEAEQYFLKILQSWPDVL